MPKTLGELFKAANAESVAMHTCQSVVVCTHAGEVVPYLLEDDTVNPAAQHVLKNAGEQMPLALAIELGLPGAVADETPQE